MHWIYILKCEDDYFYIGETTRLYRRFWEHFDGKGGVNTSTYNPENIIAIYKLNTLSNFFEYQYYIINITNKNVDNDSDNDSNMKSAISILCNFDNDLENYNNLEIENNIVECFMIHNEHNWKKIRGGKYTKNIEYKFPVNNFVKDLPICKCNIPCDVKKNEEQNYLFFRCAKKNLWDGLKEDFDIIDEPCDFFMKYTKDQEFKLNQNNRKKKLKELFKTSSWLKNVEVNDDNYPYPCKGGCFRTSKSIKLSYNGDKRNLCFDCFIDKNEELSKKYNIIETIDFIETD